MSDTTMEAFAYACEISDTVARAVGAVGSRQEVVSLPGEDYEAVTFSRGGVLVPNYSRWANRNAARDAGEDPATVDPIPSALDDTVRTSSYYPHLTVVTHDVTRLGHTGGEFTPRDKDSSGSYLFDLASKDFPSIGLFVKIHEIKTNPHTDIPTFYMLGAEMLAGPVRLEFVHGLCQRFKEATERRVQQALSQQG